MVVTLFHFPKIIPKCLTSNPLQGHNLTHILQWICFHIRKASFFRSLASNPNLRKSPEIRHFSALDFIFLTAILRSQHGTIAPDGCRVCSQIRVRSREFIKACFFHKIHPFLPLCVLRNRSTPLLLPIIYKHTVLPTASRPRSDGTSLKSHRLNLNSSRDRICTFFRFRMDMDHYVLSSLASLLFPEP